MRVNRWKAIASGVVVLGLAGALPGAVSTASAAGSVAGVVTNDQGEPLAGICATILAGSVGVASSSPSDANGAWQVDNLPAGIYAAFLSNDCTQGQYVPEYYPGASYRQDAVSFGVVDGQTTSGIDVSLTLGGSVSGRVFDKASGAPLPNVAVFAFYTGQEEATDLGMCTDAKGKYHLNGLPSGVKVQFYPGICAPDTHLIQWFRNASDWTHAKVVTVPQGGNKPLINGRLPNGP